MAPTSPLQDSTWANPALAAIIGSTNPTAKSHVEAVEDFTRTKHLWHHARDREYTSHPGFLKILHLLQDWPPPPHGKMFDTVIKKADSLDFEDDAQVQGWKKEVEAATEKVEMCQMKLKEFEDDEEIKAFVALEKDAVAAEKA